MIPFREERLSRPSHAGALITTESRYTLGRRLSSGGAGEVYLGTREVALDEQRFPWRVAMEVVSSQGQPQKTALQATALASLRCPQIVPLLDVLRWEGNTWLVSEYVEGVDLGRFLGERRRKKDRPDDTVTIQVGLEVARALRWAHRADLGRPAILHADVCPANVLIGLDGSVRLAGLGMGVVLERHGQEARWTRGTPGYIAPEVVAHSEISGGRSDVYALGVVMWEMSSGLNPTVLGPLAQDNESMERWGAIRGGKGRLDQLILRMIAPSPRLRPTAAEVVEELKRIGAELTAKGGLDASGATVQLATAVRAQREREDELETLPTQEMPRLQVASTSTTVPPPPEPEPEPAPSEPAPPRARFAWAPLGLLALIAVGLLVALVSARTQLTTARLRAEDARTEMEQARAELGSLRAEAARARTEAERARSEAAQAEAAAKAALVAQSSAEPVPAEAVTQAPSSPSPAPTASSSAASAARSTPRSSEPAPSATPGGPQFGTVVLSTSGVEASVAGVNLAAGPNTVPVGRYPLVVRFPGLDEPREFHKIEVRPGKTVTVKCVVESFTCTF